MNVVGCVERRFCYLIKRKSREVNVALYDKRKASSTLLLGVFVDNTKKVKTCKLLKGISSQSFQIQYS